VNIRNAESEMRRCHVIARLYMYIDRQTEREREREEAMNVSRLVPKGNESIIL
jgi:hypothetical protein